MAKNHHWRPPQGHHKSHPKPLKTTTRSPQTLSQTGAEGEGVRGSHGSPWLLQFYPSLALYIYIYIYINLDIKFN